MEKHEKISIQNIGFSVASASKNADSTAFSVENSNINQSQFKVMLMKNVYIFSAVLAATVSSIPVQAVDVVNRDQAAYTLIIQEGDNERELMIEDKGKESSICESCAISLNEQNIEAEGDQIVTIMDGVLSVSE